MSTFIKKVKAIAIPVTSVVVPLGVSVLSAAVTKEYCPKQDKKYKEVLQNIAIGAITSYVSAKVTQHAVESIEGQCDETEEVIDKIYEAKEIIDGLK